MIRACLGKSIKRLAHKLYVPSSCTVPVTLGELQTGTFEGEANNPTCVSISQPFLTFWLVSNLGCCGFLHQEVFSSISFFHLKQFQEFEGAGTPHCLLPALKESAHPTQGLSISGITLGKGRMVRNPWKVQSLFHTPSAMDLTTRYKEIGKEFWK